MLVQYLETFHGWGTMIKYCYHRPQPRPGDFIETNVPTFHVTLTHSFSLCRTWQHVTARDVSRSCDVICDTAAADPSLEQCSKNAFLAPTFGPIYLDLDI